MFFPYPEKEIKIKLVLLGSLLIISIKDHAKLDTVKFFNYLGLLTLSQEEEKKLQTCLY